MTKSEFPRDPLSAEIASWALFVDIDGTLADIAMTPESVRIPPSLPFLLDGWQAKLQGAVALISGRSLAQIDHLFQPRRYDAAGIHGVEWRLGDTIFLAGRDRHAEIEAVIDFAERQVHAHPGLLLERKGQALAIHYRAVPGRRIDAEAVAANILDRLGSGFHLLLGKAVVEIVTERADKAEAIARFMVRHPYKGRRPVFAGDDITDESGFALINQLGGLSIHIGQSRTTQAQLRLPSPASLRDWLAAAVEPDWQE